MSFPSNYQFLVCGNDINPRARTFLGKIHFRFKVIRIATGIETKSQVLQIPADTFAEPGIVLPDSTGEDEGVATV